MRLKMKEKYYYTMFLSAEETAYANVLLTKKEANIVNAALSQMYQNLQGGGWCGSCSIDIEHPHMDQNEYSSEYDENECEL